MNKWWTKSWNPVSGCTKVSEGCLNCYAERWAKRFWGDRPFSNIKCNHDRMVDPLHWKKSRVVFVNSMSDLFHDDVLDNFIAAIMAMIYICDRHYFIICTKRPKRMLKLFSDGNFKELVCKYANSLFDKFVRPLGETLFFIDEVFTNKNVAFGVTAENQARADDRFPLLLKVKKYFPNSLLFGSIEPMLSKIDITPYLSFLRDGQWKDYSLGWIICGGETGDKARPLYLDNPIDLLRQCKSAGVPFYFKSWGEYLPEKVDCTSVNISALKDHQSVAWGDGETYHIRYNLVGNGKTGCKIEGREYFEFPEAIRAFHGQS